MSQISIPFEFTYENQIFRDAIVLSEEEANKLSSSDIDALKLARYNNWVIAITPVNSDIIDG